MTTAVQVQYRRGSSAQVASFTGAQGEMVVDTTNNRVVVQDGSTAGGWPAALANRTPVSDAAYSAKATDRIVAYTAITAARVVALPAAASFPVGEMLTVVDEFGSCSGALTLTLSRAGSDTINGATGAVISVAYGFLAIESNGSNAWTIVKQSEASGTVAITGGTINGATIGQTTRAAAAVTALGVNESTPGTGIVNVSGSYQVAGSQISAANLSDGTTGTGAIVKADAPAFTGNPTGITALGVKREHAGNRYRQHLRFLSGGRLADQLGQSERRYNGHRRYRQGGRPGFHRKSDRDHRVGNLMRARREQASSTCPAPIKSAGLRLARPICQTVYLGQARLPKSDRLR